MANRSTTSVEPPNDTNGSGSPLVGSAPSTTPRFTTACRPKSAVMPNAR
jgi:hypothetical protein